MSQRFFVCPECGWVEGWMPLSADDSDPEVECPMHQPWVPMLPAKVIALPEGKPTPEQIEAVARVLFITYEDENAKWDDVDPEDYRGDANAVLVRAAAGGDERWT